MELMPRWISLDTLYPFSFTVFLRKRGEIIANVAEMNLACWAGLCYFQIGNINQSFTQFLIAFFTILFQKV